MAMAQGYTKEEVNSILEDVAGSKIIDEKTKSILLHAEKVTRNANKVTESDIQGLRESGCSDEEILEATFVIAYYNFMNRIADSLGVPVEHWVENMSKM